MSVSKVMTVFGTRPEAVKMAPVIHALERAGIHAVNVVTAQHRQMLDQTLGLFGISPHHDLDIMGRAQSLTDITVRTLERLAPIMEAERPDIVLVQGDTTTTFAAALSAFYHRIPVGHVEAGLRTGDRYSPFPEEINRTLAGHLSTKHFPPTEQARSALLREGVSDDTIWVTGNTVIDALLHVVSLPDAERAYQEQIVGKCPGLRERIVLVTAHRRESFGKPLVQVFEAIRQLAEENNDVSFVYPVHLNPNVQGPARDILEGVQGVHLLPPLDYLPLVALMQKATLVLTDSGGIQEEAPSLGKPVLVLREVTERPEGVEAGTAMVVGTDKERIVAEATKLLTDSAAHARMAKAVNPYGDGRAAERIVQVLAGEER